MVRPSGGIQGKVKEYSVIGDYFYKLPRFSLYIDAPTWNELDISLVSIVIDMAN